MKGKHHFFFFFTEHVSFCFLRTQEKHTGETVDSMSVSTSVPVGW